jgi:hypothetical protein
MRNTSEKYGRRGIEYDEQVKVKSRSDDSSQTDCFYKAQPFRINRQSRVDPFVISARTEGETFFKEEIYSIGVICQG